MVAPTFKKATDTSVIEHNINDYDVIVYISGSTVYARRGSDGTLVSSGSTLTPETTMQAAIDQAPGRIYIDSGTYNFSGSFTGLKIDKAFTTISMAPDAWLKVPVGYTGACFLLNTQRDATTGVIWGTSSPLLTYAPYGYQKVILEGGIIGDQAQTSSQSRSWTAIRLYAGYAGTFLCTLRNLHINHCSTGIELLADNATGSDPSNTRAQQWANSNLFENIWIWDAVIGVNFKVHASVTLQAEYGFNYNTFKHVLIQAGDGVSPHSTPTHGFKDIRGSKNQFIDCIAYDFTGTSKRSTIHSTATNTFIMGGGMTDTSADLYTDQGVETIAIDPHNKSLNSAYTAERYGTGAYPSHEFIQGRGTKASPSATGNADIIAEIANVKGYNGSTYKDAAKIQIQAAGAWSGSTNDAMFDLQLALGTAAPSTCLLVYPWGDIVMKSGSSLWFDGYPAGNTRMYESPADTLDIVAGGTVDFRATATHALMKGYSAASDPTTTEIPAGFFTVAKNTTSGAVKLFYNDGGTLRSVTLI